MAATLLRPVRWHTLRGALLPAALLCIGPVFVPPARGAAPGTPSPERELRAANELAERYGGGVVTQKPASGVASLLSGLLVDRGVARHSELAVIVVLDRREAKVKIGDRDFAELCRRLRHVPGAKGLRLEDTRVTDKGLAALKQLTGLRWLELRGCPVGDEGLKHVSALKELGVLDLSRTKVTGAGLKHLKGLAGLRELTLSGTRVTDSGLDALAGLTGLEYLDLSDTPVGNKGLARLKGLKELRSLHLARTRIKDGALDSLRGMRALRDLDLDGTALTDAGLAPLRDLPRLRRLVLSHTRVDDAGLAHLAGLKELEDLSLGETRTTEAGLKHVAELRWLRIVWKSGRPPPGRAPGVTFVRSAARGGLRDGAGGKVELVTGASTRKFLLARLHDTKTDKPVGSPLYHDRLVEWGRPRITCWAFSPEGKLVATGSGFRESKGPDKTSVGQVRVWTVPGGELVASYPGPLGYVKGLAFSKDGKKVLVEAENHAIDGR